MGHAPHNPRLSRFGQLPRAAVAAIDAAIVLAILAAVLIVLTGGGQTHIWGVRMTAETPQRPALIVLMLVALRVALARRRGLFGTEPGTTWKALGDFVQTTVDRPVVPNGAGTARRTAWMALAGYVAVALFMLWPQFLHMRSVPDLGDPLFSMWRLGWVFHQLQGDPRPLFDANTFHPERLSFTYSDSMLLPALVAAPLLAAGVPPAITYNLLFLASYLAAAMATYALAVRLTGSRRAAFIAGLFYGFHPYRFEHYSHLELQMTWPMPLALLFLHRYLDTRRTSDVFTAALLMVAQLYSSMYYGVFFALFATAVFGVLVALSRPRLTPLIAPTAGAAVLAGALALPLALPYAEAQPIRGDRPIVEVTGYSATPSDYLRAHPRSAMWGSRLLEPRYAERALFPGFVVLVLAVAALVPPIGFVRVAYVAGALVAFDMSLGVNGILYEPLHQVLSPLRSMRVAARFSIVVGVSLAVLAAYGVRRLLSATGNDRRRLVAFVAIVAAFLVDLRPVIRLQSVWANAPSIYSVIAERDDVVVAEFPVRTWDGRSGWVDALPQMYFSIWHGRNMVNGYSGFFPPSYERFLDVIAGFPGQETLDEFRARGVTHVVITCALTHDKASCDGLIDKAETSPSLKQVAAGTWEDFPTRLYELEQ